MKKITKEELLKIPEVLDEVKRHLWIESEKAGFDKGLDWAANDWINRFSKDWIAYNRPAWLKASSTKASESTAAKKRPAKSYWR